MKNKTSLVLSVFLIFFACTNKSSKTDEKFAEPYLNYHLSLDERVNDLVSKLTLEEKASQMLYNSAAIPRLNIPEYNWWSEGLHGVARSSEATVFPQAIGLAATFDKDLMFRISTAISDEARAIFNAAVAKGYRDQYKGLSFWSPNVNIFRDPRWGRGHETYGEDPFLSGEMGTAFVKGMQGDNPDYLKTAACAKHYVVHSGPEGVRHEFNAVVNQQDLYETYLPAFKKLVDADVEAVMCAYNRTNDEVCCGSKALLIDILRNDWGFDGHIVSDCEALSDFNLNHKITKTFAESAALAVKRTVNLNCGYTFESIPEAVKLGLLSEDEVDYALKPLLKTRFKLGLFDPDELNPYNNISTDVIRCKKHVDIAREAAQKSIVMLKNKNNALPLKKDIRSLFLTGPMAGTIDVLLGNYHGVSSDMKTIVEGIAGKVEPGTAVRYKHGVMFNQENANPLDWNTGNAKSSDATIIVLGLTPIQEGEEGAAIAAKDKGDRSSIGLAKHQVEYVKQLKKAAGEKPVILVLTGGSAIAIPELHDVVDAILFVWYPGEQGGNAVADVIFGDVSPSGKLPVTFPKSIDQLPDFEDYSMINRTYRFLNEDPLYPFGFGLSYTTFEYGDITATSNEISEKDTFSISFAVTNTGDIDAEEVAQVYISYQSDDISLPKFSLKHFERIKLNKQEKKNLTVDITPEMLKLAKPMGGYEVKKGTYKIYAGGSSPMARSAELGAAELKSISLTIK